jgi:hypothetical protein
MSESIRYESAERVRDFYREQGRKQERERIIELVDATACILKQHTNSFNL